MRTPSLSLLAAAIAVVCIAASAGANPGSLRAVTPQASTPELVDALGARPELLLLRNGAFDPLVERLDFSRSGLPAPGDRRYGIVQFHPGEAAAVRALLVQVGAQVVGFLPNNAYQVRWDERARMTLATDAKVRWAGVYEAGYKVAPALLDGSVLAAHASSAAVELEVHGFRGENAAHLAGALLKAAAGIELGPQASTLDLPSVRLRVPAGALTQVVAAASAIDGVVWIEPYVQPQLSNRDSVGPIQNNSPSCAGAGPSCAAGLDLAYAPIWNRGLLGTGQIVSVSDSGLDRNEQWFTALDLGSGANIALTDADSPAPIPPATGLTYPTRKVYGYWVQPGATAYDNTSTCPGGFATGFHGTHVVGSVLGDAAPYSTPTVASYTTGDGMAPNAQVLFQDIGNDTSGCLSITDFAATLLQADAGGAGIHSGSWGAATAGAYSGNDQEGDAATWLAENLLVNIAAGNSGPTVGSVGSPGNGKNIMTVGGTNHGFTTLMYSSSSRGPTDDGRRKPDILAPATSIVSAAGDTGNGPAVEPPVTSSKTGTSMATPTISGGAALLRQYFSEGFYPLGRRTAAEQTEASGTLMKAAIINGAAPFTATWPDNNAGWGRMWLANSLYFEAGTRGHRHWVRDNGAGLETGDLDSFEIPVTAGVELRATLTWYDPEGALGSAINLVNNLDLELVAPGGATTYLGNVYLAGQSTTGGTADNRNTVEQVRLTAPAAGTYTLRVRGTSVPGNGRPGSHRQGYALVVGASMGVLGDRIFADGFADDPRIAAPASVTVGTNGSSGVQILGSAVAGATSYQLYRAAGTCAAASTQHFRFVGVGAGATLVDTRSQGGYTYAYRMRAVKDGVEGPLSTACAQAVSLDECSLTPTFDDETVTRTMQSASCAVNLNWQAGTSNCPGAALSYRVYRDTSPLFGAPLLLNTVPGTSYNDTAVSNGQPYYYRIDAIDAVNNVKVGTRIVNATPTGVGTGGGTGLYVDDIDDNTYMTMQSPWSISNQLPGQGAFSYRSANAAIYPPNVCADLLTLPVTLAAGSPQLLYQGRWQLEQNWDGVVVEISNNGGATWAVSTPVGGYPGTFSATGNPPVNACAYPSTQGAFTGASVGYVLGTYQNVTHDLTAFAGQQVLIRWRLSTDPGAEEGGMFIDNVRINAQLPAACTP